MFSNRNKIKLSVFVLNISILNILSIQPAQALYGGSGYITVVSDSALPNDTTAAKTALEAINGGTEVFADFATAGVTKAVLGNKAGYDTAIASSITAKGSSLTLMEVQTQIALVNAAAIRTALAAINGGTEVFADFATAGVTKAVLESKDGYDTAIATAIKNKESSLILEEIQTQIDLVNAATAQTALTFINGGTEVFADFATAGVTSAVQGNKDGYDTAIATAIRTKGSGLTLTEVKTQIALVNAAAAAAAKIALTAINGGTGVFADFLTAGVTNAIVANKAKYDSAIIAAIRTKGSRLTLPEVQRQITLVNSAAALAAINGGTEVFADFATAGVTKAVLGNKAAYDTAIVAAISAKGSNLTLAEVQTQIALVNSAVLLTTINVGNEVIADFATAGVTKAVPRNKDSYDAAIVTAIKTKGSSLTLAEIQAQITLVNAAAAKTALATINGGTEVFADFATAGVKNAIVANKAKYDSAIITAITTKGSSLTLAEVQTQIDLANAAADAAAKTALAAINGGTEVFTDFATAGVTSAIIRNKNGYDTAIATAITTKGSDLTLAEVKTQIAVINAATALAAINGGTMVFADFATAGVTNAIQGNKDGYHTAIVNARRIKGSSLTLAEVKAQIAAINAGAAETALAAINEGTEVFADFAIAGVTKAVLGNKDGYHTAILTAIQTKGTSLTLTEVQTQITVINAATTAAAKIALASINGGTEVFADFSIAGVTKAVLENKDNYHTAIATAIQTKGFSLTLAEVQTQIGLVNSAAFTTALVAINEGTEIFADFATAGVTNAVLGSKKDYDTAIATARNTKGSNLTLTEVKTQIAHVNTTAKNILSAINEGTAVFFSDFATVGVTNAVKANRARYQTAIAAAIMTKGSNLTLEEVQKQVDIVNATTSLAAINEGTEVFADFATAGVTPAVLENKDGYHNAIATAINTKHSSLTLAEVLTLVKVVNATAQH